MGIGWRFEMGRLKTLIAENVKPLSVKLEQLVKNAELAQSLQKETFEAGPPNQLFKDELSRKLQRLRLSIGRISLVSFHPKFPQMGPNNYHSTISNAASLRRAVKIEVLEPGRKVPEKSELAPVSLDTTLFNGTEKERGS
jgi:hypothetical protein